jgi:transposase
MTGAEWAVCEPLLPAPAWLAGRGGRPASWCMRDIADAIRYLTHNGPVWRALPAGFPPAGTVYWWADKWQADGAAERMHDDLRDRAQRESCRGERGPALAGPPDLTVRRNAKGDRRELRDPRDQRAH